MTEHKIIPQLGQIVRIKRGREQGLYAVVVRVIDDRYVMLADGEKRKTNQPKKKNINHIKLMNYISPEVRNSLLETDRVSNGKLRFALATYASEVVTDLEKGDQHDVERRCN